MILVTGATGKVGSEAVRLLREHEVPVRALVRDLEKARSLTDAGAELTVGDFGDRASLDAAAKGVTTVLLGSPGGPPEQELAVVSAGVDAGVTHVVKLTSRAAPDSPIARQRWHAQVEQGLADSGLAHTLLRSNAYMQNTLMLGPSIARTNSFASSIGNGRIGMIDARDVAAVATAIALDPAEHVGRSYWLSGPELVTYTEVAETLSRLLGRTITFTPRTREEDEAEMVRAGLPQEVAAMNALAVSLFAQGDAEWLSDDAATILGHATRPYEKFAADHLARFSRLRRPSEAENGGGSR